MSDWTTTRFSDLFAVPLRNGVSYPARTRGTGVRMVNMKEIFAFDIIADQECERVPLTDAERRSHMLAAGDLLFARQSLTYEGAGKCVLVGPAQEDRTWESHLIRVKLSPERADSAFYFNYFRSPIGRRSVEAIVQQVAAAGVRGSDLARLLVPVPSLSEQRAIAEVLGAVDDKIAANRKLVESAETLASALFRSMMEAEPVSVPLSSTAQFINGKAFTKDASGTGRVVVRIAELNSGIGGSTVFSDLEVADQYVARPGDLLFAWSGSLTLHRWFRDEAIINQHIFKVIPAERFPSWLVYQLIRAKLPQFKEIAADKATTMGHIQRKHLDEPVPVPSSDQIASQDVTMSTLWDRTLVAEQESLRLSTLRDTLLPRLMSGKLRVRDAEREVEEVL